MCNLWAAPIAIHFPPPSRPNCKFRFAIPTTASQSVQTSSFSESAQAAPVNAAPGSGSLRILQPCPVPVVPSLSSGQARINYTINRPPAPNLEPEHKSVARFYITRPDCTLLRGHSALSSAEACRSTPIIFKEMCILVGNARLAKSAGSASHSLPVCHRCIHHELERAQNRDQRVRDNDL